MTTWKRTISLTVLAALLLSAILGSTAFAANAALPKYVAFSGKIVAITQGSARLVMLEDANGNRVEFDISASTYVDGSAKIQNGSRVICFYDTDKPAPAIEPPRFSAEAIAGWQADENVLLGQFDENLVNEGNTLKLLNTEKAEIVYPSGNKYTGSLQNMTLLVFYGASTRSIPAQTSPTKIVVFTQEADAPAQPADPGEGSYNSFTGKVISITRNGAFTLVMLQGADGSQTGFNVGKDTILFNGAKLAKGRTLTGFYAEGGIAPAIFPPQYAAHSIAGTAKGATIFVGKFDEGMVSADGSLKLLNADKSPVVDARGKKYGGPLANQTLAVIYKTATFSIPAQTNATKIVVLSAADVTKMPIIAGGKTINGSAIERKGVVLIPAQAAAEALGFNVMWHKSKRTMAFGEKAALKVNNSACTNTVGEKTKLKAAPVLYKNIVYAPLDFFTEALGQSSAAISENRIVIG